MDSDINYLENGTPQGSMVSPTLLNLNIISREMTVDRGFISSLYVDYLLITYSHSELTMAEHSLQSCINRVSNLSDDIGFQLSPF